MRSRSHKEKNKLCNSRENEQLQQWAQKLRIYLTANSGVYAPCNERAKHAVKQRSQTGIWSTTPLSAHLLPEYTLQLRRIFHAASPFNIQIQEFTEF